jgi:hypothetical protein
MLNLVRLLRSSLYAHLIANRGDRKLRIREPHFVSQRVGFATSRKPANARVLQMSVAPSERTRSEKFAQAHPLGFCELGTICAWQVAAFNGVRIFGIERSAIGHLVLLV